MVEFNSETAFPEKIYSYLDDISLSSFEEDDLTPLLASFDEPMVAPTNKSTFNTRANNGKSDMFVTRSVSCDGLFKNANGNYRKAADTEKLVKSLANKVWESGANMSPRKFLSMKRKDISKTLQLEAKPNIGETINGESCGAYVEDKANPSVRMEESAKRPKLRYRLSLNNSIVEHIDSNHREDLVHLVNETSPANLLEQDGPHGLPSLCLLLRYCGDDVKTADAILLANHLAARAVDRKGNTPLHYAIMYGACLHVVRHLCIIYPEALLIRNFNYETPITLSFTSYLCNESVQIFLTGRYKEFLSSKK